MKYEAVKDTSIQGFNTLAARIDSRNGTLVVEKRATSRACHTNKRHHYSQMLSELKAVPQERRGFRGWFADEVCRNHDCEFFPRKT